MSNRTLKVAVIGPESTGKSRLCAELAEILDCLWVKEYAREYLENLNRPYVYSDLLNISEGQFQREEALFSVEKKILLCDTNDCVLRVWSEHKYSTCHPKILHRLATRSYDFYLLTQIDLPWEDDPLRENPEPAERHYFFNWYHALLQTEKTPFAIVSGIGEERTQHALQALHTHLPQLSF